MSTGYDLYCTTLSQEGRIYQLEYASKAIEKASTVLGIIFKDGVVLLSEKIRQSKAIIHGSNPTVYSIAPHIGLAICGMLPDGRNIMSRAKLEASSYLKTYGIPITGKILCERLAIYIHAHTCHWGARPFGCCVLVSSCDNGKYHLYMVENSGNFYEYYSASNGKGKQFCRAEVEKNNYAVRETTVGNGINDALKILVKSYEGEKDTEYDVGVISNATNGEHQLIDNNFVEEALKKVKDDIKNNKMDVEK